MDAGNNYSDVHYGPEALEHVAEHLVGIDIRAVAAPLHSAAPDALQALALGHRLARFPARFEGYEAPRREERCCGRDGELEGAAEVGLGV